MENILEHTETVLKNNSLQSYNYTTDELQVIEFKDFSQLLDYIL